MHERRSRLRACGWSLETPDCSKAKGDVIQIGGGSARLAEHGTDEGRPMSQAIARSKPWIPSSGRLGDRDCEPARRCEEAVVRRLSCQQAAQRGEPFRPFDADWELSALRRRSVATRGWGAFSNRAASRCPVMTPPIRPRRRRFAASATPRTRCSRSCWQRAAWRFSRVGWLHPHPEGEQREGGARLL